MKIEFIKRHTLSNGKVFKKGTELDVLITFGRDLIKKRIAKQIEEDEYGSNERTSEWK